MIRAFFTTLVVQVIVLFLVAAFVAGFTEKSSTRGAEYGLLVFGIIDFLVIGLSIWFYRTLSVTWGGASAPMWSVILLGLLALCTGAMMLLATLVLFNR